MPRVFLIRRHLADLTEFEDEGDINASIFERELLAGEHFLTFLNFAFRFSIYFFKFQSYLS